MICQWLMCLVLATTFYTTELALVPDLNFKFEDPKGKYVFHYPTNWEKNKDIKGFDLFITAPKGADGRSLANMSIISGELPPEVDLDTYYAKNKENLLKNPSIKLIDEGRYEIAGQSSRWLRYTRDDDHTEIIHYFLVVNGVGVLITGGAAKEAFKDYVEVFSTIAKTMHIPKK